MAVSLYQKLIRYFTNVSVLFHKGSISFSLHEDHVAVFYHLDGRHSLSSKIPLTSDREVIYAIQDFCLGCYYENEWDCQPMKSEDLGILIGVSAGQARWIISNIYNSLRKYGGNQLQ